jgi:hypothetical protein
MYHVTFFPFLLSIALKIQCGLCGIRSQDVRAACAVLVGG